MNESRGAPSPLPLSPARRDLVGPRERGDDSGTDRAVGQRIRILHQLKFASHLESVCYNPRL